MIDLKQASDEVQKAINDLPSGKDVPLTLYEPYYYIMEAGGKRIRPSLCVLACSIFSENWKAAVSPAVGIEIFHNFTLVHDDIMDKSDFRRNRPTLHKKWNVNTAILTGDVMMIKASEMFGDLPAERYQKIMPFFLETARKVCEGQQFDMDFESEERITLPAYMIMIRLKTAELLAGSLKIGALIGNAPENTADALYRFGIHIGTGFQLRDDYLDVYANQDELGKPLGSDILNKKKTCLYLAALEKADFSTKDYLVKLFSSDSAPSHSDVKEVTEIYNRLRIPEWVNEKIAEQQLFAMQQIDNGGLPGEAVKELADFAAKMTGRVM
jgi:geranylgeranyl diphosphate synthase type II